MVYDRESQGPWTGGTLVSYFSGNSGSERGREREIGKREKGKGKGEEGRGKREEGRGKREEGRGKRGKKKRGLGQGEGGGGVAFVISWKCIRGLNGDCSLLYQMIGIEIA
jgi:hypothetical protein